MAIWYWVWRSASCSPAAARAARWRCSASWRAAVACASFCSRSAHVIEFDLLASSCPGDRACDDDGQIAGERTIPGWLETRSPRNLDILVDATQSRSHTVCVALFAANVENLHAPRRSCANTCVFFIGRRPISLHRSTVSAAERRPASQTERLGTATSWTKLAYSDEKPPWLPSVLSSSVGVTPAKARKSRSKCA